MICGSAFEADVLGAQIPVRLDDAARLGALVEQFWPMLQEAALLRCDRRDEFRRQTVCGNTEFAQIFGDTLGELVAVGSACHRDRRTVAVETREAGNDALDILTRCQATQDQPVEHARRGQPTHLDQPIDRAPVSCEPQVGRRRRAIDGTMSR